MFSVAKVSGGERKDQEPGHMEDVRPHITCRGEKGAQQRCPTIGD